VDRITDLRHERSRQLTAPEARDVVCKFSGMHPARSGYHVMSKAVIQSIDELRSSSP
jgi:lysophospholipase L1-like esterase